MDTERAELFQWLRLNRVHFKMMWTPHDVAWFAIHMNGFPPDLVYEVLSHFDHALCGMDFEKSLRQQDQRLKDAMVLVGKADSFEDQWNRVHSYQTQGTEFQESSW